MSTLYINSMLIKTDDRASFPFTFQISDIKEPEKRKGGHSTTLRIPGTQRNMQVFSSVFNLSMTEAGTDSDSGFITFDPTVKAEAVYSEESIVIFRGVAQILSCTKKDNYWTFEVSLFSDFINFMSELKKIKCNELGYSELTHELNIANTTETWAGNCQINNVSTSIFTLSTYTGLGYYYGVIDYGFTNKPVDSETFDITNLPPQLFAYDIIKKMFDKIGVEFDSVFLESDFFKSKLVAWEGGELPSVTSAEQTAQSILTTEQNTITGGFNNVASFQLPWEFNQADEGTPDEGVRYYNLVAGSLIYPVVKGVNILSVQDNSNQILTDYPYGVEIANDGLYDIIYDGEIELNAAILNGSGVEVDMYLVDSEFIFDYSLVIKKNGVVFDELEAGSYSYVLPSTTTGLSLPSQVISFDLNKEFLLEQGDVIEFEIKILNKPVKGRFKVTAFSPESTYFLKYTSSVPVINTPILNIVKTEANFIAGQDVLLRYFAPKMDCAKFFKGIINTYNLFVDQDPENPSKLRIEPLEDFYKPFNDAKQWGDKIDYSKDFKVIPTASIASSQYKYSFLDTKSVFETRYLEQTGKYYGNRIVESGSDFSTKMTDTKLPFSCIPLVEYPSTDLVLPRLLQEQEGNFKPKKSVPFLLFKGVDRLNNKLLTDGTLKVIDENSVTQTYSEYPFVGHLDSLDNPNFDLTFKVPDFVFFTVNTYYSNVNLYQYHSRFIREIVDKFGRQLNAYLRLTSDDINNLDFAELKNLNGVVYRLQKVNQFDKNNKSTLCEFIKAQDSKY